MAQLRPSNMTSKSQAGTTVYAQDNYRTYLMIVAGAGGITIALADGAAWGVGEGNGWEPSVCPISSFTITGTCVVVTNSLQP